MLVECPICLSTFIDPVSLNECSHTFCKLCLEILPVLIQDGESGIECPKCRKFCQMHNYRQNHDIRQLMDIYKHIENKEHTCRVCEKDMKRSCVECRIELCRSCKGNQDVDKNTGDKLFSCEIHQDKGLHLYCLDCSVRYVGI